MADIYLRKIPLNAQMNILFTLKMYLKFWANFLCFSFIFFLFLHEEEKLNLVLRKTNFLVNSFSLLCCIHILHIYIHVGICMQSKQAHRGRPKCISIFSCLYRNWTHETCYNLFIFLILE